MDVSRCPHPRPERRRAVDGPRAAVSGMARPAGARGGTRLSRASGTVALTSALAVGLTMGFATPIAAQPMAPVATVAVAGATSPGWTWTLKQALEAAWLRQPEQRSAALRREAADAQRRVAQAWTPEPPAVEASWRTDQLTRPRGARELEIGVSVPLWLPGEQGRAVAAAEAQAALLDSDAAAARWRLGATVRDAWWAVRLGQQDLASARARLDGASALAADVARRVRAGDLARADQHQADGAVAAAQAEQAAAHAQLMQAAEALRAVVGSVPDGASPTALPDMAEAEPLPEQTVGADHPALRALQARLASAQRALDLGRVQTRGNPELSVLTTRDRAASGEPAGQTVTLGIRIPLGSADRGRAKAAAAGADLVDAEAALDLQREQLQSDVRAAQARVRAAREGLAAADRRAQLARETAGFFDKSFRLGETDLPTRLRVEQDASDAERQRGRARLERDRAVSQWRQALGLPID